MDDFGTPEYWERQHRNTALHLAVDVYKRSPESIAAANDILGLAEDFLAFLEGDYEV